MLLISLRVLITGFLFMHHIFKVKTFWSAVTLNHVPQKDLQSRECSNQSTDKNTSIFFFTQPSVNSSDFGSFEEATFSYLSL